MSRTTVTKQFRAGTEYAEGRGPFTELSTGPSLGAHEAAFDADGLISAMGLKSLEKGDIVEITIVVTPKP